MSGAIVSIEKFRLALLRDSVTLGEIKDELVISTGTVVPLDTTARVNKIYYRWARINSAIREPDTGSIQSFSNYISYLILEIEKWKTRELSKFNRAVNTLYSETPLDSTGIDDLISTGLASADQKIVGAAKRVESTIKAWMQIFPNMYSDDATGANEAEHYFDAIGQKCRLGLTACGPESRLIDMAARTYDGESGQASWMTSDVLPDMGSALMHNPSSGGLDVRAYGNRGFTRQVVITNSSANVVSATREVRLATVPHGGITISYFLSQFNEIGSQRFVLLVATNTLVQYNTAVTDAFSTLRFIVRRDGTDVSTTTRTYGDGGNVTVSVPYAYGSQFSVHLSMDVMNAPATTVAGIYITGSNFMLTHPRSVSIILTGGTTVVGVPLIGDIIGQVASPFTPDLLSSEVAMLWRVIRAYNGFQFSNNIAGISAVMSTQARGLLSNNTFVFDDRVLDFGWWLANTADFPVNMKQTLYRRLYSMLDDYLVLALSDVSFRRHFLA